MAHVDSRLAGGHALVHFAGFTVTAVDEALTHQLGEFTLERRQIETVMQAARAGHGRFYAGQTEFNNIAVVDVPFLWHPVHPLCFVVRFDSRHDIAAACHAEEFA